MLNSIVILCRIASSLCHAKHMWSRKIVCLVLSNRDCTFSQCEEGQAPGQGRALQKPCCQQKLAVLHTGLKLCIVNKHKTCGYGQACQRDLSSWAHTCLNVLLKLPVHNLRERAGLHGPYQSSSPLSSVVSMRGEHSLQAWALRSAQQW